MERKSKEPVLENFGVGDFVVIGIPGSILPIVSPITDVGDSYVRAPNHEGRESQIKSDYVVVLKRDGTYFIGSHVQRR